MSHIVRQAVNRVIGGMPALITLTKEEREKFAAYLEQEAHTLSGLLEQMKTISVPEVVQRRKRNEALACLMIAEILRTTEDMSIRG